MSDDNKPDNQTTTTEDGKNEVTLPVRPRANARTRRRARECAEEPALCITGSSNSGGHVLRCLGHGVDSLYMSHKARLRDVYLDPVLPDLKRVAQSDDLSVRNEAQLKLGHHIFEVQPKGRGTYPYLLRDNAFQMSICDGMGSLPCTYTQVSSEYLAYAGVEKALEDLDECVGDITEYVSYSKVSRVDLHLDVVTDFPFINVTGGDFAKRAPRFVIYFDGMQFEGLTIGKGDLILRIYDKTKEIKKSKKFYMYDIWKAAGWDGKSKVIRVEFQIRSKVLKEHGIVHAEELIEKMPGLWAYCCQWVRLVEPSNHQSLHRHPTHPIWSEIAKAFGSTTPLPRKKNYSSTRIPPDYYLFGHGMLPVLSFMAIEKIDDLEEGFRAFREGLKRYHRRKDSDPEALDRYLKEKIEERRRQYNIKMNPPDSGE